MWLKQIICVLPLSNPGQVQVVAATGTAQDLSLSRQARKAEVVAVFDWEKCWLTQSRSLARLSPPPPSSPRRPPARVSCPRAPIRHVEARCVRLLVSPSSSRCRFFRGILLPIRFDLVRWPLGIRGGCAGGKAKPLKAPKADKKEYDEVRCRALSFAPVPLRVWLVAWLGICACLVSDRRVWLLMRSRKVRLVHVWWLIQR